MSYVMAGWGGPRVRILGRGRRGVPSAHGLKAVAVCQPPYLIPWEERMYNATQAPPHLVAGWELGVGLEP